MFSGVNELQREFDQFVQQWAYSCVRCPQPFTLEQVRIHDRNLIEVAIEIFDDLCPQMNVVKRVSTFTS
jgi:hypothetical protein